MCSCSTCFFFFFFNDTATTEIYTLSLHDALPISTRVVVKAQIHAGGRGKGTFKSGFQGGVKLCKTTDDVHEKADRKSTRLNSSHLVISYAVFCLKKKKNQKNRAKYKHTQKADTRA